VDLFERNGGNAIARRHAMSKILMLVAIVLVTTGLFMADSRLFNDVPPAITLVSAPGEGGM
jgi:hypothetical protein